MINGAHIARKRFGQNFLHDHRIIDQIVAYLQIKPGDHWVEIGPGQGALTGPLIQQATILDVVELDRDLVALLQQNFHNHPQLKIHSADALNFDFSSLVQADKKLRVVGNLPYNISTPLLFHLFESSQCISDMHFMLQKEVVERLCAEPGSKKYGKLSVMAQYYCTAEWLFDVPPECFSPAPQVTSSIVRLIPHANFPVVVHDYSALEKIVTQAFSQRRKTLRNSLKILINEQTMINLGIDPHARAETLSLAEFARLSNMLSPKSLINV